MTSVRGTASTDTGRFSNKNKKLLKKMKFPSSFSTKVNMDKVSLPVIKKWIAERILELLGFEDDILVQFIFNMLETAMNDKQSPDPRTMQIQLTGFLERDAKTFTEELWKHITSAARNPGGIPTQMLEATKRKLAKGRKGSKRRRDFSPDDSPERKKKEARKKDDDVEVVEDENMTQGMKEMLASIKANKEKIAEEKKSKRNIPRSLADCISPVLIAKAKKAERQEARKAKKKEKELQMKMMADREAAEEDKKPKAAAVHPERANNRKSRSRSRSPARRRRSASPPRRKRRRMPSISASPSPPREFMKSKKEKKRRKTRRRSRSRSSS